MLMNFIDCASGLVIGVILTLFIQSLRKPDGVLNIDHTNPEKDIYLFVFNKNAYYKIKAKMRLVIEVNDEADLSQK